MTDSHDMWRQLNPAPSNPKRAALYARSATISPADGSSSIEEQKRAVPPFGYRAVKSESRGAGVKKRLEIDPHEAEIVKLIFRLAMIGPTGTGPAGAMRIARELNQQNLSTRKGQPFSNRTVNNILHRTTYSGRRVFNLTEGRTKRKKPPEKQIIVPVPAIIDTATFEPVQITMRERNPFGTQRGSQAGESKPSQKPNRTLEDKS